MQTFSFTSYRNSQDTAGEIETAPWADWQGLFSVHAVRGVPEDSTRPKILDMKKNGPAIILGPVDGPRKKGNVRELHALALDLDHSTEDELVGILRNLLSFTYAAWTTHRHGSEAAAPFPRFRVILPLAAPLSPQEHTRAWGGLNRMIGGANDPATKDASRLHFLPSTFDSTKALTYKNDGRFLSLEDLHPFMLPPELEAIGRKITHGMRKDDPLKEAALALWTGRPFACEPQRHDTVLTLTMWLAKQNRTISEPVLRSLFFASLFYMAAQSSTAPTHDEVWTAYQGAVEKVDVKGVPGRGITPYSAAELEAIAAANGCSVEQLEKRWILVLDGSGWFLTDKGYMGPCSWRDMPLGMSQYLARAPVRLVEPTKTGFRYRAVADVLREHGTKVKKVVCDMMHDVTRFDEENQAVLEAVFPPRKDLIPTYSPEIDGWLKTLGGKHYEKLVDWLSVAPDLTKILCAIYFDGPKGAGKTLFAHGVAKIWSDGSPAEIKCLLKEFNADLLRNPLVLGDEEIPRQQYQSATTILRSELSVTSRTLKRKYLPEADLKGAIRIILTANNELLLESRDVMSAADLDATAQRFLYIKIPQKATDLLEQMPRSEMESWATRGIAEHALWLAQNHEVKNVGKRFAVEGDVSTMVRLLMTGSAWNSLCCEWLVRYLLNPNPIDSRNDGYVRVKDKELLVNAQALIDGWEQYMKGFEKPNTAKIGAGLRMLAKIGSRTRHLRWGPEGSLIRIRYRVIDPEHLIAWADRNQIGDRETIKKAIEEKKELPENVVNFPDNQVVEDAEDEDEEERGA